VSKQPRAGAACAADSWSQRTGWPRPAAQEAGRGARLEDDGLAGGQRDAGAVGQEVGDEPVVLVGRKQPVAGVQVHRAKVHVRQRDVAGVVDALRWQGLG
jgi:hypothetical protein